MDNNFEVTHFEIDFKKILYNVGHSEFRPLFSPYLFQFVKQFATQLLRNEGPKQFRNGYKSYS